MGRHLPRWMRHGQGNGENASLSFLWGPTKTCLCSSTLGFCFLDGGRQEASLEWDSLSLLHSPQGLAPRSPSVKTQVVVLQLNHKTIQCKTPKESAGFVISQLYSLEQVKKLFSLIIEKIIKLWPSFPRRANKSNSILAATTSALLSKEYLWFSSGVRHFGKLQVPGSGYEHPQGGGAKEKHVLREPWSHFQLIWAGKTPYATFLPLKTNWRPSSQTGS